MKLSHKLISGLVAGLLLLWVAGFLIISASRKMLEEHFLHSTGIISEEILFDIQRDLYSKIDIFREYCRDTILQAVLERTNHDYEKMNDREAYISGKDLGWNAAVKNGSATFINNINNNELSVELREKRNYYQEKSGHKVFSEIFVTNKYGVNIAMTEKTAAYRHDNEKWWQITKEKGLFVGDIKHCRSSDDDVLQIGIRISDEDGNFIGVMKVLLSLQHITDTLKNLNIYTQKSNSYQAILRLFLRDEKLIYSTVKGEKPLSEASLYLTQDIVRELHQKELFYIRNDRILSVYAHSHAYKDIRDINLILAIQYSADEVFAPVIKLQNYIWTILISATFIALLMGITLASRIATSVRKLRDAALKLGKGSLQTDIDIQSRDEIGELATAFNQMKENLQETNLVRDRLTEDLQGNEERLRSVIDTANDAIVSFDSIGDIYFWNMKAEMIFGHSADEAVGMKITAFMSELFSDFFHEELAAEITNENAAAIGKTFEFYGLKKDGDEFPAEISLAIWKRKEEIFYTAIIRDITQRKHAEDLIYHQFKRLNVLHFIDKAVNSSIDLHATLDVFTDQITTQLGIDSVTVLLMNKHTRMLEYATSKGFRSGALKYTHLQLGESNAGRAALEQRIITIPDLISGPDGFVRSAMFPEENFVSYFAVPLIAKSEVKGVLELFTRNSITADQEWLEFLETIADQAAIAIDHASLFRDLQRSRNELIMAYDSTIIGWSNALDLRDKETEGHSLRVMDITMRIAEAMGIEGEEIVHIRRGALMHDIGKMGVPDSILLKPGKLSDEEWVIMKQHPEYAYRMLSEIDYLKPALDIPYYHHEKWDGTGYPKGLKGKDIPLSARIFAIVDVWDALTSKRPYRPAWSKEKALGHIRSQSGTHFDPEIVEIFLKMT